MRNQVGWLLVVVAALGGCAAEDEDGAVELDDKEVETGVGPEGKEAVGQIALEATCPVCIPPEPVWIGLMPRGGTCPGGTESLTLQIDDENYNNKNYFRYNEGDGWWDVLGSPVRIAGIIKNGATNGTYGVGKNTNLTWCRVPLPSGETSVPWARGDYVVLRMSTYCPSNTMSFTKFEDTEDSDAANSTTGNTAWGTRATNDSHNFATFNYCFAPQSPGQDRYSPAIPWQWENDWALQTSMQTTTLGSNSRYYEYAISGQDDEDNNNSNSYTWHGSGWTEELKQRVIKIVGDGGGNSYMKVLYKR